MRRVGAHVSAAGGPSVALKNISLIEGNCLQIFAGSPRSWDRKLFSKEDCSRYLREAGSLDIKPLFVHALYLVNLAADNPDLLRKSVDSLIFDMQNGASLYSAGVIVHLGSHQGRGFPSVVDQVAGVINQILNATSEIPFVIENSAGQKGKIGSLSEIGALFAKVNSARLKLCLDSAHLFEAGYNLCNLEVIDNLVNELSSQGLLEHLVCLHINDSKTGLGSGNDRHENLGDGKIGLLGLSQFITHPNFSHLPLILEVPGNQGFPDARQITLARSLFDLQRVRD